MAGVLIAIPARLQATRLPGKPMADIHGEPMIVHVWRRAIESQAGRVVVAADDTSIIDAISKVGGDAVMTRTDHASGSDRVLEAASLVDPRGGGGQGSGVAAGTSTSAVPKAMSTSKAPASAGSGGSSGVGGGGSIGGSIGTLSLDMGV